MSEDTRISEFLDKAQAAGIPHQSLVGLLTARGWREKDVYHSLGDHYRRLTGLEIPSRLGSGASAKDAFFYLLIFSTLATWTCGLGSLAFQLIGRWLPDPLFSNLPQQYATYEMTWAMSAILIAFPIYLLISRIVLAETAANPEKLDSGIRKWLTYMALVIAASVFIGDLICAVAFLLRGELTSRFVSKSLVVLVLSGGVFYYYFGGLSKVNVTTAGPARDRLMAAVTSGVVALMVILGFSQLGAPNAQRQLRADEERLNQLYRLSMQIETYWKSHASQLPPNLAELHGESSRDPLTHNAYEYVSGQGSKYRLCAVFAQPSQNQSSSFDSNPWSHPSGRYCFQLDATEMTRYPSQ